LEEDSILAEPSWEESWEGEESANSSSEEHSSRLLASFEVADFANAGSGSTTAVKTCAEFAGNLGFAGQLTHAR
jgi:hypothetical protein